MSEGSSAARDCISKHYLSLGSQNWVLRSSCPLNVNRIDVCSFPTKLQNKYELSKCSELYMGFALTLNGIQCLISAYVSSSTPFISKLIKTEIVYEPGEL